MSDLVVVVTGGGRGIGRAVCERFAAGGARVIAASRSADELEATCAAVERAGGACLPRRTDVTDPDDLDALLSAAVERFGRIDVLVNNAGAAEIRRIEDLEPDVFDRMLAVNVEAVYRACRSVWTIMKSQQGGVIVNTSSISSVDPFSGFAAYGASKAWVNAWTKGLADEGRPLGIRVFAVAPGAVETQMLRGLFPDFPKDQTLAPADVADVIHALAQPACRTASGQTIFIRA